MFGDSFNPKVISRTLAKRRRLGATNRTIKLNFKKNLGYKIFINIDSSGMGFDYSVDGGVSYVSPTFQNLSAAVTTVTAASAALGSGTQVLGWVEIVKSDALPGAYSPYFLTAFSSSGVAGSQMTISMSIIDEARFITHIQPSSSNNSIIDIIPIPRG